MNKYKKSKVEKLDVLGNLGYHCAISEERKGGKNFIEVFNDNEKDCKRIARAIKEVMDRILAEDAVKTILEGEIEIEDYDHDEAIINFSYNNIEVKAYSEPSIYDDSVAINGGMGLEWNEYWDLGKVYKVCILDDYTDEIELKLTEEQLGLINAKWSDYELTVKEL